MPIKPIHDVENMPPKAIELFEAAGYMDVQSIFDHDATQITTELIKANNVLEILDTKPDHSMVMQWLKPLESQFGKVIKAQVKEETPKSTINIDPSMLVTAKEILNTPFAVPISEDYIQEHSINLTETPTGTVKFLNKEDAITYYSQEDTSLISHRKNSEKTPVHESPTMESPAMEPPAKETPTNDLKNEISPEKTGLFEDSIFTDDGTRILNKSRILKMETFHNEGGRVDPIKRNEEINLTKTTRKETNAGVSPESRFYIKGVLHKSKSRFKYGCHSFIFVNILLFLSLAITSLVIVDKEKYWWAVWAPLLAVLAIFMYFTSAQSAACPICNQKQFAIKTCRKHKNAHHWPIFGYMLPTALHALFFKWFRCIFCGTSVRLKE